MCPTGMFPPIFYGAGTATLNAFVLPPLPYRNVRAEVTASHFSCRCKEKSTSGLVSSVMRAQTLRCSFSLQFRSHSFISYCFPAHASAWMSFRSVMSPADANGNKTINAAGRCGLAWCCICLRLCIEESFISDRGL